MRGIATLSLLSEIALAIDDDLSVIFKVEMATRISRLRRCTHYVDIGILRARFSHLSDVDVVRA